MVGIKPNYKALDKALKSSPKFLNLSKSEKGFSYYAMDGYGTIHSPKVHVCTFFPSSMSFSLRGDLTDAICETLIELLKVQMDGDKKDYCFGFSDKWHEGGDFLCEECTKEGLWEQAVINNFEKLKDKFKEIVVQLFYEESKDVKLLSVRFE